MDFKIEKNIPIPSRGLQSEWVELLRKMEVGDSVTMTVKQMKALSQFIHMRSGGRFKIATRKEQGSPNYRVWLTQKGKEKLVQEREEG